MQLKFLGWAKKFTLKHYLMVFTLNHPNENELRPTEDLTRAEAAVLLYRLRQRLDLC